MDSPLTLACALEAEERVARGAGAVAARVGLAAALPLPEGKLVSFGLAGALVPGFEPGTLLTARKVVGVDGASLWEGEPLSVPGALVATVCSAAAVVDDPRERQALAERTGAVAVDLETGPLAQSGRLVGVVRAIGDTPARPVGLLARAAKPDGRADWAVVGRALVREPRRAVRAALGARRALASLRHAARALGPEGARA